MAHPQDTRETERRDPRFDGFETKPVPDMLALLLSGQRAALDGVGKALPQLTKAVEAAATRLHGTNGRLVYVGAGTSGRLAMLDGIELTPTFGWPMSRTVFLFAGGAAGLEEAVEGAEDDKAAGLREVEALRLCTDDVMIAVAASGTTPYTRAAVIAGRKTGALTIGLANNDVAPLLADAEIGVLLASGAEVLAGSTRLGAGTSQKAALNMFSTALMARLNKIHRGFMVDMLATNDKLVARAEGMVVAITGCDAGAARSALAACDHHTKRAVLIVLGETAEGAAALLAASDGNLAQAMAALGHAG